jgi:hypothetical protein
MSSISRSILARSLMTFAASLPFAMMAPPIVRAETVIGAQGGAGANCSDLFGSGCAGGDAGDGESVLAGGNPATAIGGNGGQVGAGDVSNQNGNGGAGGSAAAFATGSSGSTNVTVSASATGGNGSGSVDSNLGGAGGDADAESAAASSGSRATSSSANATGGSVGICEFCFGSGVDGGAANATSTATSTGSGAASSSATASGGLDLSDGGSASASSTAASGGGTAIAKAVATGGVDEAEGLYGVSHATSNAATAQGALAQAKSTAVGSSGQAQSTAKTSFAGVSVQSTAVAPADSTGTTNAIAQGGAGQAFANPGQTAYAFATALPDKAYSATLIDGAQNVAGALLGPRDVVFGTAILGANYAADGGGESHIYSATSTFDFGYRGDLLLGLIGSQEDGFAGGLGFQSIEFTITANGVELFDSTFRSLSIAESFFRDSVIDLGSDVGPDIDLTLGYTLVADGSGGFGFDLAVGGAVPEPSTWAMMLLGFAGLGYVGYRKARQA